MAVSPVDLGEQAAIMIEGVLLSELSLRCSFDWNGDTYPCAAGPEKGGKRLDEGGYRLSSKLQIKVRVELFPDGIGIPQEKQTILYKRNASAEPKKYRIDSVTNWYGAVLQLDCEDPGKSA